MSDRAPAPIDWPRLYHELRRPLAVIQAFGELLEDEIGGPLTPDQREYVGQVLGGVDDLERLVRQLQAWTRESTGEGLREHDLGAGLRRLAERFGPAAAERLELRLPAEPVEVWADPERLEAALFELVANALRFGPSDTPVELAVEVADGHAHVVVADRGPGLPAGARERLFEPFRRADVPNPDGGAGLGLGLAVARAGIEDGGGRLWAENGPQGGARLRVRLEVVQRVLAER